jgi:hypothetical protein
LLDCWQQTFFVITFKYQYNTPSNNLSESTKYLLKIVINTLDSQYHNCELDLENDKIFQQFKKQREKANGIIFNFNGFYLNEKNIYKF